jgi:hypothetical protein
VIKYEVGGVPVGVIMTAIDVPDMDATVMTFAGAPGVAGSATADVAGTGVTVAVFRA